MNETQTFIDSNLVPTDYRTDFSYALDTVAHTLTRTMTPPSGQVGGPQAGRSITHIFDKLSRLVSAAAGAGIGATWTMDQADRRTAATLDNGVVSTFTHDVNDRLTNIVRTGLAWPDVTSLPTFNWSYGYDAVGNRLFTRNSVQPDRSEHYGYDNRDRLTLMERGVLSADGSAITTALLHPTLAGDQQWANLDRRGNWRDYREAMDGTTLKQTRVVNGVNEYESIQKENINGLALLQHLQHDAAGNLTEDPTAVNAGDNCPAGVLACGSGQRYEYDEENRVVAIRRDNDSVGGGTAGQLLIEYEYDALGRRVYTTEHIDAATGASLATPRKTRHVYAGIETIEEYTCGAGNPACACDDAAPADGYCLAREFLWGDSANFPEPVALIDHTDAGDVAGDPTGPGEVLHYLHDVLGSVVALTDATGAVVERYTYDPYGKTLIERWDATADGGAGAWTETNASHYANPFTWTAQRYDATVHLYGFFARTYSPTLGRWLQRDPLEYIDGVNLYQYVLGNPTTRHDPSGLSSVCDWLQKQLDLLDEQIEEPDSLLDSGS